MPRTEADSPAIETVRRYFAAPPAGPAEHVPAPAVVVDVARPARRRGHRRHPGRRVLQNRRAAMLCYGLLQLDRETLATVAGDAGLLRRLYERHSGVFAAFAQVLQVRDGRLVLPGGDDDGRDLGRAGRRAAHRPVARPSRALRRRRRRTTALLRRRRGGSRRAAARPGLPRRHRRRRRRSIRRAASTARSRASSRAGSSVSSRSSGSAPTRRCCCPCCARTRPPGGFATRRAFWEVVLGDRRLPDDVAERWANLDDDERAEPGWLLRRLTDALLPGAGRATADLRVHRAADRSVAGRVGGRPGVAGSRVSSLSRADADARTARHRRRRGADADGHSRGTRHVRSPTTPRRSRSASRCIRRR